MSGATPQISYRMERGILILFTAAAAVMGFAVAQPSLRSAVAIAAGDGAVSLLTHADVPFSDTASDPRIVSATFDSAVVVAQGLTDGTRTLLVLGAAFSALTALLAGGAVMLFFLLLMWRRPFHRALVVATQIGGGALLLGGLLSGGLGGLGRMMAADELNPAAGDVFVIGFRLDPGWIAVGFVVLLLSLVFSHGHRLQRDTEGLV